MALRAEDGQGAAEERKKRVAEAAKILGLEEYLERKPKALSGGQRQRVAMGRAIVRSPQVFCMDEPLSNLDAKMRVATRTDIAKLQADLGVTTVYVTHDQVEAMTMGDRVAVMKLRRAAAGRHPAEALRQAGQPVRRRLHRLAADEPARGQGRRTARPRSASTSCPVDPAASKKMERQHHRRRPPGGLADGVGDERGGLPVTRDRRRGARRRRVRLRHLRRRGHAQQHHRPRQPAATRCTRATTIYVTTDPQHVHVFDTDTGERLSD